VKTETKHPCS